MAIRGRGADIKNSSDLNLTWGAQNFPKIYLDLHYGTKELRWDVSRQHRHLFPKKHAAIADTFILLGLRKRMGREELGTSAHLGTDPGLRRFRGLLFRAGKQRLGLRPGSLQRLRRYGPLPGAPEPRRCMDQQRGYFLVVWQTGQWVLHRTW